MQRSAIKYCHATNESYENRIDETRMHSYQKFKYIYINVNFRKSIKNITKGIIKIHYTAPHLALNLYCLVTIYEKILYIGPSS